MLVETATQPPPPTPPSLKNGAAVLSLVSITKTKYMCRTKIKNPKKLNLDPKKKKRKDTEKFFVRIKFYVLLCVFVHSLSLRHFSFTKISFHFICTNFFVFTRRPTLFPALLHPSIYSRSSFHFPFS